MKKIKKNEFIDRLKTSADAKATMLAAYRTAREAAEPTREIKQAERIEAANARTARRAEREQARRDDQRRTLAEAAEREAELVATAKAEIDAREMAEKNRIARVIEDEAVRKAKRDRRYAARKARNA